MNRKLFYKATFICVSVFLLLSSSVFASDVLTPSYSGYGQDSITRSLTEEENQRRIEKENAVLNQSINEVVPFSTSVSFYLSGFSAKQQEETNYCGPASSQAFLSYKGINVSQTDLAADWDAVNGKYGMNTIKYDGTTSPDMARSINHYLNTNYYISSTVNSSSTLWSYITHNIGNTDNPVNLLVDTKHLSYYNGKSLNHFVTAHGFSADDTTNPTQQHVDLADPHYNNTYFGIHYSENFNNVFNAVNSQNWRPNVVW